jgi:hypothetical protein
LPRSHLHMFRTIHRLLKFFGFGGLRHILIPEAAHVSGHVSAGVGTRAGAEACVGDTPALHDVRVAALPQDRQLHGCRRGRRTRQIRNGASQLCSEGATQKGRSPRGACASHRPWC